MTNKIEKIPVLLKNIVMIFFVSLSLTLNYSCDEIEELLGLTEEEEYESGSDDSGGGGANLNASYEYTYTCPASGTNTITIPSGTTKCQKAQEFFARTYACNDVDNFNSANCRVCNDCESQEWKNYCSVCN